MGRTLHSLAMTHSMLARPCVLKFCAFAATSSAQHAAMKFCHSVEVLRLEVLKFCDQAASSTKPTTSSASATQVIVDAKSKFCARPSLVPSLQLALVRRAARPVGQQLCWGARGPAC